MPAKKHQTYMYIAFMWLCPILFYRNLTTKYTHNRNLYGVYNVTYMQWESCQVACYCRRKAIQTFGGECQNPSELRIVFCFASTNVRISFTIHSLSFLVSLLFLGFILGFFSQTWPISYDYVVEGKMLVVLDLTSLKTKNITAVWKLDKYKKTLAVLG